jgi:hypothetical protein
VKEGTLTPEEARGEIVAVIAALDDADAPERDSAASQQHTRIAALHRREQATEHLCVEYAKLYVAANERAKALVEALEWFIRLWGGDGEDDQGPTDAEFIAAIEAGKAALTKAKEAAS